MINSPLLPLAYDISIVEPPLLPHPSYVGWARVLNSPLLSLAYDNSIVEPLTRGGGGVG